MWYGRNNSNGQGLIIDEETGRNVAISYDEKDTNLLSCAPELRKAIQIVYSRVMNTNINTPIGEMSDTWEILRKALTLDKTF
jgi:hypothetical protein